MGLIYWATLEFSSVHVRHKYWPDPLRSVGARPISKISQLLLIGKNAKMALWKVGLRDRYTLEEGFMA